MVFGIHKPATRVGLTLLVIATAGFAQSTNAQKTKSTKSRKIPFEELVRMMADQPDHVADRTIAFNDSVVKMKFAKKQDKVRNEFYPLDQAEAPKLPAFRNYKLITITKTDQPVIALDPQEKTYAETPPPFSSNWGFDVQGLIKSAAVELGKISAEMIGTVMIAGQPARKMKIGFGGKGEFMHFYFAKDSNLVLKVDSGNIRQIRGSYSISNVSFNVPDDLFEPPPGYRRVDFDSFIETFYSKSNR
jgi:hypothetical protein